MINALLADIDDMCCWCAAVYSEWPHTLWADEALAIYQMAQLSGRVLSRSSMRHALEQKEVDVCWLWERTLVLLRDIQRSVDARHMFDLQPHPLTRGAIRWTKEKGR